MTIQSCAGNLDARTEAWIGLSLIEGWGPVKIWRAVGQPPDPIFKWNHMKNSHTVHMVKQVFALAKAINVTTLTWDNVAYPPNLRSVETPPPVLYLRGTLTTDDLAAVALVGSRRASPHALQLAFILARDLASCGITVVSGLATGVDAAAHRGALAAGGRTIAVVASGLDSTYPPAHIELANQVAEAGAVISQFPCGTGAVRSHFPIRNRTMAALSLGTVVVEAPERSGALITAHVASEMGREVMACPGDVLREHTRGSNNLLRDGAHVVQTAKDIIDCLYKPLRDIVNIQSKHAGTAELHPNISLPLPLNIDEAEKSNSEYTPPPVHREVWDVLRHKPYHVDSLVAKIGLDSPTLRCALTELEMLGYIKRDTGDMYSLVKKKA